MVKKNIKFEGNRGDNAIKGRWIGLAEAQERAQGEKWWKHSGIGGEKIQVQQSNSADENGPNERPIWLFENGDMYLDEWKMRTKPRMDS